jgi:hypothetical protein
MYIWFSTEKRFFSTAPPSTCPRGLCFLLLVYMFQGAGVDRTDTGAYLRVDLQSFGVSSTNPHWFSTEKRFLDPQVTVLY